MTLRVIRAPYFVATRLEAFRSRSRAGGGDWWASRDIEDVVAVLDGRPELLAEVESVAGELQAYVAVEASTLLARADSGNHAG